MDPKQPEVVLLVQPEQPTPSTDPKTPPLGDTKSPENTLKPTHSPSKPPKPPQREREPSFLRRRSIVKPKSRFVEQPPPPAEDRPPQSRLGSPKTPLSATTAKDEEEDEDGEIYKREQDTVRRSCYRRLKVGSLVEWAILVVATGMLVTSLAVDRLQDYMIRGLEIWRWCLTVAVICCGRLVSHWFITVLVFLIERNFLLTKKVLYFVYGLKKSVQVFIWLSLVLLSWFLVFNRGVPRSKKTLKVLNLVSRALISLLVGSVIWLVKTLLVKILASSFHMSRFFDRIQESIYFQYVLQTLSGPPLMEMAEQVGATKSAAQLSFRSVGKGKGGEKQGVIDVAKLHRMRQEKVSAWTMKGLINVIRSSGLSTLSGAIDESFANEEQRDREITSEWEARAAARQIFKNVAKPGYKYIDRDDLLRFLSRDEVDYVMPLFEGAAETQKIKKSALKNWVVKAYFDRKSLAHSLNDTKTAVSQLHKLATTIVLIVNLIITLMLMGIATTQVLVFISSQLLLVAFMFGNTAKTAFEAIIFVFVMHPFDVGDRCVVDGVQMVVEEMNILTTVFLRFDNEKIYYPNSVLATKPISNFYRSPDMSDTVDFSIDVSTSVESLGVLKARIKTYLESKPNHWHPNHNIVVKDIVNVNKMNMVLYVNHTINYQNIMDRNSRRTDLVLELKKIFEELSIRYNLLPQDVNLTYTGSIPLPMAIKQSS